MALMMEPVMALIMLGFMWGMYKNRGVNIAIIVVSLAIAAGALWLLRSQKTVSDLAYMKAMIPHHSIAVMTIWGSSAPSAVMSPAGETARLLP